MAELAGSIIGIVSAGTKVALVLSQLAADVGSAGQEARMIGSGIRSFCAVLKTLGNTLEKLQDSSYYTHCFEMVRDMTDASLEMFTEILNAVESLRHMTAGKDGKDGKFGLVGKLQWVVFQKPKLLVLRAAIEAYKSNLALMLGTLEVTEKVARRLSLSRDGDVPGHEEQERALLQSLSLDHRSSLITLEQAEQEYMNDQNDHEHAAIHSALEEVASAPGASPRASVPIASTIIDDFFEEAKDEVSSLRHSLQNHLMLDAVSLQAQATEHSNRLSSLIETEQRRLSERWSTAPAPRFNVAAPDLPPSAMSAFKLAPDTPRTSWIKREARNDVKYQGIRAWILKHPPKKRHLILAALIEDISTPTIEPASVSNKQEPSDPIVEMISDQMMHQRAEFVQNSSGPVELADANKLMFYHIDLDAQGLDEIPSKAAYAISRERIASLTLARNHLTALPSSLCLCSHLTSLDLGRNNFKVIPDTIRSISKLQALDLRDNHIRSIPTWIAELGDLKVLSLSRNQIQGIPFAVGQMQMLEILDLVGNQIVTPSSYIVDLMSPGYSHEPYVDKIFGYLPMKSNIVANANRTQRAKATLRLVQFSSVSLKLEVSH
ncbi:hypothetical protein FB567DRAFT_307885 [Paraphoma chrysanthemicola]|uniref:Fungal N-terminal domain-containing protein n=1 Tax=Paraphoma chrysanthemicola TaxID=798071 RepID=A0A8K0R7V9_9PLEO|nr:hypothetical protein FB567DRAFT_307885 [Paraphoma chrysanthemicola]